ncbi:MAG TPA: CoA transferase [Dehalococcoidia bacterium]|nr:CoA transferase [Dehalococcoidia bacterium]
MLPVTGDSSALDDLRVLDLAGEEAVYCTKLLADLGADVIRVEPPGGSPIRRLGPFVGDIRDPERSIQHLYFNTSKRGVTLDIAKPEGRELFLKLAASADVIVESFKPGFLASLGLGYDDLTRVKPDIILTSVTGFGQTGPHSGWEWSDLIDVAMSGILTLSGFVDAPPYRPYPSQAYYCAGVEAAIGTLLAVTARDLQGEGQWVDVSIQESLSMAQETAMQTWDFLHRARRRVGGAEQAIRLGGLQEVADGYVFSMIGLAGAGAPLAAFVEWLVEEGAAGDLVESGVLADLKEVASAGRGMARDPAVMQRMQGHIGKVADQAKVFLKSRRKTEIYVRGQQHGFLIGAANDPKDIVESEQLIARGWFQEVPHPELGMTIKFPGVPYHLSDCPARVRRRAPLVGEHNAEVYGEIGVGAGELAALKARGVV